MNRLAILAAVALLVQPGPMLHTQPTIGTPIQYRCDEDHDGIADLVAPGLICDEPVNGKVNVIVWRVDGNGTVIAEPASGPIVKSGIGIVVVR